ncbi:WSC domain-containing protein [Coniochaeta sp. 2T2.1]|nr:WSC domain-containing protein [Coniochaeta sp. 2T2.1]
MASNTACAVFFLLTAFSGLVHSLASTDTITWGGDNTRAGYQTNHNLDPSVVGSDQFAQLFKTLLPGTYNGAAEQIYSQPLVFTPSDGVQYVYFATTQNNVYKLNAKTGAIVASRNLAIPFLTADLDGCVDINPTVGITSTGVIDPGTETLYLTLKTYANQNGGNGPQGRPNGRYYLHALNVNDLSERPNFPVNLEGTVARNNPTRSFNGGIHHQRPALLHSGQYIYAGFASHCVQYNFTGWIMGWDKTTGSMVERWATEGEGVPNSTPGGGVWMSGGGLASDDAGSMFFATGNGYASQLATVPVNGRTPPTSLEEAAVHMTINGDGSLSIVDFFMPYEKQALDGADKDLGTSPLEILPSTFSCGDVRRIGVVTGKSGKTYWLNLDNLGGYRNGAGGGDAVIQVYQNENSVYAGAGVYPLEGGYIYINVINFPSHVFKFACANGVPSFTKVADSPTNNAAILGVGHGTVTSLNGQPGTGLVWTSDVQGANLRIYNAIPSGGSMTLIKSFSVPGTTKFTRPVFGDGIVYMGTTVGYVYGFGAPTNSPLNCTGPVAFGTSELNVTTAETTVTCTAKVAVTVTGLLLNSTDFGLNAVPAVPLAVAAGSSFSFKTYFRPSQVGLLSTSVAISTTNNAAGYSVKTQVRLSGTGSSANALLDISPAALAFQEVVTGGTADGVDQTVLFANDGGSALTITSIEYSQTSPTGPFVNPASTAAGPKVGPFTFKGLPTTIAADSDATVTVNFNPTTSGNYTVYVVVASNGGSKTLAVTASSGQAPVALLQFQTPDGSGWVTYESGKNFTFGNVTENTTRSLKLRLTNGAPAGGVTLSVTVSKPPFGVSGIIGANNQVDLGEGTTLAPGESETATLYCSVPKEQWNVDPYYGSAQWTMNTNDPNWGKQFIQFACGAVSEQAPPLRDDGLGRYRYVGCFKENNPGRQLANQLYGNDANTNAMCIAACANKGYKFCGTQYNRECWGGPKIPTLQVDDLNCNYPCSGDLNQVCGGNGVGAGEGGSYISLFRDSLAEDGGTTPDPPTDPSGPYVNPGVDGYSSIGCYTEATGQRALPNGVAVTTRTVASCIRACASKWSLVGLEYGGECWCGNALGPGAVKTNIGECNMLLTNCTDNSTEYCGAGNRLNVYEFNATAATSSSSTSRTSTSTVSTSTISTSTLSTSSITTSTLTSSTRSTSATPTQTGPAIKQTVGTNWQFQGCFTEATSMRALSDNTYADDTMTLESCATFCGNYKYFGVEYGRECYCGNTLNPGSVLAANQNDCSFLCPGNNFEYCGAGNRLELYQKGAATSSSSTSTPVSSIRTTSSQTSVSTSSTTSRSSSSSSTISSTTSSSTSAVPTLGHRQKIGAYSLVGCWTEGQGIRALTGAAFAYDGMTLESCMANCAGFAYWGTEYGRECYCGGKPDISSSSAPLADCNMVCGGDATEYCGAGNRLELYSLSPTSSSSSSSISTTSTSSSTSRATTTTSSSSTTSSRSTTSSSSSFSTSTVAPSTTSSSTRSSTSTTTSSATPSVYTGPPVIVPGNVNFTYYHCVAEPSSGRVLNKLVSNLATATVESCLQSCWMYKYAGIEYGSECWCGDGPLNFAGNTGATPGGNVSDTLCNKPCKGNSSEFCGAGLKLSLYAKLPI